MPDYPLPRSILVDLELDRVSLCNQGANSRAHILLTKRKENSDMPKTFEELLKAVEADQALLITNHIAELEKAKDDTITKLNGDVTTLTGEVETLKKSVVVVPTVEDITKNASPELTAYIAKLKGSVDTLVAAQEEALAKSRFEEVKAIPADAEEMKNVLKSASPATFAILKKAATAIEATLLINKGKETLNDFNQTADQAYDVLAKAAKVIAVEKSLTFEQAFVEACANDSDTYTKYVKGDR